MEWEAKKGVAIHGNSFTQIMANLISNVISGEKTFSPASPKTGLSFLFLLGRTQVRLRPLLYQVSGYS
jgi:hypothetical protein